MNETKTANAKLGHELVRSLREGDGCPVEADESLNNASRGVVSAMHEEHGKAWLWRFDATCPTDRRTVEWDGATLCTFGADAVTPCDDQELRRLLVHRGDGPYSMAKDRAAVEAIFDRVRAIGGHTLVWS